MAEGKMEEFDGIPDEETINLMNEAYSQARVRQKAAQGCGDELPEHCRAKAEECAGKFARINACIRAFFERSARGRELLRELLPMSESLLARACELAGCDKPVENVPLKNAAICRRTLALNIDGALLLLAELSAYSQKALHLEVSALALAYLTLDIG